ncbi:MAG: NUDIX domain-containing protein [Candidatus Diapherotrites archaeon]
MRHEKSAGAIVFFGSMPRVFLVLHYAKGHWDFPKGHIEKGESEQEAMLRELQEETGLSGVNILDGFSERINYFFTENREKIKKDVVFFLVESKTKNIRLSDEHVGYEWLPYEEAFKRITFRNSAEVLKKAKDFVDGISDGSM